MLMLVSQGLRRVRQRAIRVGLLPALAACATDEGGSQLRGEAILRVQVTAQASGAPVARATIRLFADYELNCAQPGPRTAELLTDDEGALRIQAEGAAIPGGTCFSLAVVPPAETDLRTAERVPFVLKFRPAPPFDSVQVNVTLAAEP